jgi:hypothetical protein
MNKVIYNNFLAIALGVFGINFFVGAIGITYLCVAYYKGGIVCFSFIILYNYFFLKYYRFFDDYLEAMSPLRIFGKQKKIIKYEDIESIKYVDQRIAREPPVLKIRVKNVLSEKPSYLVVPLYSEDEIIKLLIHLKQNKIHLVYTTYPSMIKKIKAIEILRDGFKEEY